MDLGLTDQDAVLRAEWLEAVVAISQMLADQALTFPGQVHTIALCFLQGRWVGWVGDLAPGTQSCQSTSCQEASGAQRSDPLAVSVLALA